VPPATEKKFWERYIYLWINFAVFEEEKAEDYEQAGQVYEKILTMIPHHLFTFSKLWISYAQFQIRRKNLDKARKIFGTALGKCPRPKIFKAYADLEMQLGEVDRCRKIYEKQVDVFPSNSDAWTQYAEFEAALDELDRSRAIFELAIEKLSLQLDMPEKVWKAYIDFEVEQGEVANARQLYERLLVKSQHVKVWISYGQFETEIGNRRKVFEKAYEYFRTQQNGELKEERLMVLENWLSAEQAHDPRGEMVKTVKAKFPKRVKKRRKTKVVQQNNAEVNETAQAEAEGWEEFYDYVFPDDEQQGVKKNLKILEMAQKWKATQ